MKENDLLSDMPNTLTCFNLVLPYPGKLGIIPNLGLPMRTQERKKNIFSRL